MNVWESIRMAFSALRTNLLRSALTLLGIVIGVFAVVAAVTAVEVIDVYFQDSLRFLGSSTFSVSKEPALRVGGRGDVNRPDLTYEQVRRLQENVPYPIAPQEFFAISAAKYKGRETPEPNIRVIGSNEHLLGNFSRDLRYGRSITPADVRYARPVTVITPDIASQLFPNETPLSKWIRVDGRRYQVVGVLTSKGSFLGQSFDQRVYVPITRLLDAYGRRQRDIRMVSVRAPSVSAVPEAMSQVIGQMRVIRKVGPGQPNNFEVDTNESMQSTFSQFTSALTAGGAGIGVIALLAAGIGIMNIMLVSVTERTKEIGIRKAVGAKRHHILVQFLLEALVLCIVGGMAGIVLGGLFGNLVAVYFGIAAAFPWTWAFISIGAVTVIALIFGSYPAFKAAGLDPIASLRYE
jgi:putative ABC transport system permease protein